MGIFKMVITAWAAFVFPAMSFAVDQQRIYVEDQVVLSANASEKAISAARSKLIDRLRTKAIVTGEKLLAVSGDRVVRDGELKETTVMSVGSRLTLDRATFEQRSFGSGRKILRGKATFIVNYSMEDALANLERVAKREGVVGKKVQIAHLRHEIERFRRQLSALKGWDKHPTSSEIAALQKKLDKLLLKVRSAERGQPVLFIGKLDDLESIKKSELSHSDERVDMSPVVFKEKWTDLWESLNSRYHLDGTDIVAYPVNHTIGDPPSDKFYTVKLKLSYENFRHDWIRFMEAAFNGPVVTTGYGHCLVFDPAKSDVLQKANMRWIIRSGLPVIRIGYDTEYTKWMHHTREEHSDFPVMFFRIIGDPDKKKSFMRLALENTTPVQRYNFFYDGVYVSRLPIKKAFRSDWHVGEEPLVFDGKNWKLVRSILTLALDMPSKHHFKIAVCIPGGEARIRAINSTIDSSTDLKGLGWEGNDWPIEIVIDRFANTIEPPQRIQFAHDVIFSDSKKN